MARDKGELAEKLTDVTSELEGLCKINQDIVKKEAYELRA